NGASGNQRARTETRPCAACLVSPTFWSAGAYRSRPRPGRSERIGKEKHSPRGCTRTIHPSTVESGRGPTEERRRVPGVVRRRNQSRYRTGIAFSVHRNAPELPCAAHAIPWRGVEHYRSDDEN